MPDFDPLEVTVPPSIDGTATKSRRKRKKKKKKKKQVEDDNSSDDESGYFGIVTKSRSNTTTNNATARKQSKQRKASTNNSNLSTPQELLVRRLVENDGYEASRVEQAMEEMWEKGMLFDEYASVSHYLRTGASENESERQAAAAAACGTTTVSTTCNSVVSVSTKDEEGGCEEFAALSDIVDHSSQSQSGCGMVLELTTENVKDNSHSTSMTIEAVADGDIPTAQDGGEIDRKGEDNNNNNNDKNVDDDDDDDEESVVEEEPAPAARERPTSPPTTMAMKLDTVARFGNLTDAIFALTQWVKQAAKDDEIETFCRAEETSALPTVIRRGISSEIEDTKRFETAVQPALVRLLIGVLNQCGIDELGSSVQAETEERIQNMLKQARKVTLLTAGERNIEDDGTVVGDKVSRFIVSRLAIAMDEKKEYDKHSTTNTTNTNDNKNNNNNTGSLGINAGDKENDAAMVALLSQRDYLKADATRACTVVQKSMQTMFGDNTATNGVSSASGHSIGHSGPLPSMAGSLDIQDITLHIVDEETRNRFDDEKARLEELKSQVREEDESSETVQTLRDSVSSLETKRQGYQKKIAELRAALEELEAQETDAALRIETLSAQIGEEEQNDDDRAKQLEEDILQAKESVRYGNLVSGLAGMMKSYGKTIEKATASKTGKAIHTDSREQIITNTNTKTNTNTNDHKITNASTSRAMEDYLSSIKKYFLTEARCATQLKHRLATKTAEVTALKAELAQYDSVKGLFSTSSITSQIKQAIAQNEQIIPADTQRIAALAKNGRAMYDELLSKLETYRAKTTTDDSNSNSNTETNTDGGLVVLLPTELLRGVPAAIRAMKIVDDCDRLVAFVEEEAEENNTANDSVAAGNAANATVADDPVLDVGVDVGGVGQPPPSAIAAAKMVVPTPPTTPYVAPKLAWAGAGAKQVAEASKANQKKHSLLDIQKEELIRSRDDNNTKNSE